MTRRDRPELALGVPALVARSQARRELRAGQLAFDQALVDDRLATMAIYDLLIVMRQWGRRRALRALRTAQIFDERKRARDLTDRQRTALADAVSTIDPGRRAAA